MIHLALCLAALITPAQAADLKLTQAAASRFAKLALACVRKEFPNKPDHVMKDAADVRGPKAQHPAFYGCYDWHSCVHGHWLLAHLLKEFPDRPQFTKEIQVTKDKMTQIYALEVKVLAERGKKPAPKAK